MSGKKEEDLHKYFIQPGESYFLIYFIEKERTRENEKDGKVLLRTVKNKVSLLVFCKSHCPGALPCYTFSICRFRVIPLALRISCEEVSNIQSNLPQVLSFPGLVPFILN